MSKDLEVLESLDKLEECAYAMKDLPMSNWIDLAENEAELDLKIMDWVETIKLELFKGKQDLDRLEKLEKIFSDSHICEIKERFNEIECSADKCDNCPLGIGDGICLKKTFERKWELQKENQELKRKYESHDFLYQNEVSKNGNLAGKIFEKDLKIKKLEKAIEIIKKHFIIKLEEEIDLNGNVWGRLVSIQSKEDEGTWDTTACANIVNCKEEFNLLKEVLENDN